MFFDKKEFRKKYNIKPGIYKYYVLSDTHPYYEISYDDFLLTRIKKIVKVKKNVDKELLDYIEMVDYIITVIVPMEDVLINTLSDEVSKQIDKEIMKKIMTMI